MTELKNGITTQILKERLFNKPGDVHAAARGEL